MKIKKTKNMKRLVLAALLVLCLFSQSFAFNLVRKDLTATVQAPGNGGVVTLISQSVTTPNSPGSGTWRVRANYNLLVVNGNASNAACELWVTDQQSSNNIFADQMKFIAVDSAGGFSGSGSSKNVYGSSTTIHFLLQASCYNDTVTFFPQNFVPVSHLELELQQP
jgi:hypothetical protein